MAGATTLENLNCPLGCVKGDSPVLVGKDILHGMPGDYSVVRCSQCGLMRTNPRPTAESIGSFYPDDYGPYLGSRVQEGLATNRVGWAKRLKKKLTRLFDFKTTSLPPIKPGRMLEIGCASGSFMHAMATRGWQVEGIEFSEKAGLAARRLGHPVHIGPLETADSPTEPFDLVVGWMVLEHLHEPVACLQKLKSWSNADAYLALSVPNASSFEFRLFKQRWYALQLPTHLYHFTPDSLSKILEAGGWQLVKVQHQRVLTNLIVSAGHFLKDKGFARVGHRMISYPRNVGLWNHILYPLAFLLAYFGQTGRMTVWARPIREQG